jgi:hypothetical protein
VESRDDDVALAGPNDVGNPQARNLVDQRTREAVERVKRGKAVKDSGYNNSGNDVCCCAKCEVDRGKGRE